MKDGYRLLGCRNCGSIIVEAALVLADISYAYEEVNYDEPGPARDRLVALNPLVQVPTLVLPDGTPMTESAAIIFMIDDVAPRAGLVPPSGAAERNRFLRWLIFLVAAVYPTFTYGDSPGKWLPKSEDADALREATDRHREQLWRQVESAVEPRPWFLGERFSALDIYMAAMTHWRPRQEWFARECPNLSAIAAEVERLPALQALFCKHYR